jgi:general secretion pathway protein K
MRLHRKHHAHQGAALLMAMITVALIATLAVAALWRQWRGIEIESAERTRVQSAWLLTGALDWARILLQGDLKEDGSKPDGPADHLGEPWAVPLAESRLSDFLSAGQTSATDLDRNAFLSGQITDLQSRLNVLDLTVSEQATREAALLRFTRLFQALGLPAGQPAALQRNLICASAAIYPGQANNCTASGNAGGDVPLLPQRVEQLAWFGLDSATLARLLPYVTVLPLSGPNNTTPVNLNTASSVVIYAALPGQKTGEPGLQLADAERLVALRQSEVYFRDVATALQKLNVNSASLDTRWASVKSDFFEVRGQLRLDNATLQEIAAVQRTNANSARAFPLWRARSAMMQTGP